MKLLILILFTVFAINCQASKWIELDKGDDYTILFDFDSMEVERDDSKVTTFQVWLKSRFNKRQSVKIARNWNLVFDETMAYQKITCATNQYQLLSVASYLKGKLVHNDESYNLPGYIKPDSVLESLKNEVCGS